MPSFYYDFQEAAEKHKIILLFHSPGPVISFRFGALKIAKKNIKLPNG